VLHSLEKFNGHMMDLISDLPFHLRSLFVPLMPGEVQDLAEAWKVMGDETIC